MRTVPEIMDEWGKRVLAANQKANEIETIAVILDLGMLGSRLLAEAAIAGGKQVGRAVVDDLEKSKQ